MTRTAILVGITMQQADFEYSMAELANLAEANAIEPVGEITQKLDRKNKATYVGKGKVDEIKSLADYEDVDLVIFNDELAPSQIRNLEELLEIEVMDRTRLILDIFAERAKTREAQLQVQVARLKYELPRVVGQGEGMDQQSGKGGLKNRGAGETKLEMDRRRIKNQISQLNKELDGLVAERQVQRRQRQKNEIPVVSLVGYTNAGKSTIMNAMVTAHSQTANKQVFEKDMLFATLETSVREIVLPDKKQFLLTDTVGFVSKLPHNLVKAFRSTLEEAAEADVLIHVVDVSHEHFDAMIKTTEETLAELDITDRPIIFAYNKADLATNVMFPRREGDSLYLSAREDTGLELLIEMIKEHVFNDYKTVTFVIPFDRGDVVSYLNENADVLETAYENEGTVLRVNAQESDRMKYAAFISEDTQKEG
ncbi:GTPase HflX [Listeria newyorkensis]|uniref:GTPase HflX n=1 Tax=Listeria newyorkensis TaxID=1497681 RepID=A0ABX4XUR5_9LIST|nr:GTPase HflX [Listeria newyorkensis]KGL44236.1 GTP-binding protein [Listeria newyorkensis]PNP93043.1 GTPase HflX [Listeria newyorkensis]WAO21668.1 GTPase HflX [Listeria newyorkensis]SQC56525.1 GTP-binding protein HflX [Listeria newyorkensis]